RRPWRREPPGCPRPGVVHRARSRPAPPHRTAVPCAPTLTRRTRLAAPLAAGLATLVRAQSAGGSMQLAMHQNTSRAAGFRGSLEGWARAGSRYVGLTDVLLDRFPERGALERARAPAGALE